MDKKSVTRIEKLLKEANTGASEVTLEQAVARICAELHDPYMKYDNDKGTYHEANSMQWQLMMLLSAMGNSLYTQLYDTRVDKKGRVKGNVHKLTKAVDHVKRTNAANDGTEIALQAVSSALDWKERLEAKVAILSELYDTVADFMEVSTGMKHTPLEPWLKDSGAKQEASSELQLEVAKKLEAMGMTLNTATGYEAQTNGVETPEAAA